MKLRIRFKLYALCSKEGDLLLDPQANPFTSFSKETVTGMADKNGYRVKEVEPVEADAEINDSDLPRLATKLSGYV